MNRNDLQQLADLRIAEAGVLLSQGKSDGAYYLAGYSVECGLKACIARLTKEFDFPDKQFVLRCYAHNLEELVVLAGLRDQRKTDTDADSALAANWSIAKDWNESSRYARETQGEAQALHDAIADADHGVLKWIRIHW